MRNAEYLNSLAESRRDRDDALRLVRELCRLSGKYREIAARDNQPELLPLLDELDSVLDIRGGER